MSKMKAPLEGVKAMALRADIKTIMEGHGHTVLPWGHIGPGPHLVIRPGGISEGRALVEVWIINRSVSSMMPDPDNGLDEVADVIYGQLRGHLMDIVVTPGPPYDPTGKREHSTMILTGTSPQVAGLGR